MPKKKPQKIKNAKSVCKGQKFEVDSPSLTTAHQDDIPNDNSNHSKLEKCNGSKPTNNYPSQVNDVEKKRKVVKHKQKLLSKEESKDNEGEVQAAKDNKTNTSSKKIGMFNPLWLNPQSHKYRSWAMESKEGKDRVYCKWCDKDILINSLYGVTGHLKKAEHLKHQETWNQENPNENLSDEIDSTTKKMKLFEYDFCSLIIQLNLSFLSAEPILSFLKMYSQLNFIQNSTLNRHKVPEIIKGEIEPFCLQILHNKLKAVYFSIIVDEVSDLSKKKFLAIMVQYLDSEEGIVCKLVCLKECSLDTSADKLFEVIQEEVLSKDFSENLIALVSDGASVMNGIHNSILSKLKFFYPNLWYLHCICHCLHLAASNATEKLPSYALKFVSQSYKYFSKSPKRTAHFETIIAGMDIKIKKLLKSGKTRWLSLEAAIKRILELWDPLKVYFEEASVNDLHKLMEDPSLKIYLEFLSVFLGRINALNRYFQKEVSEILEAKNHLFKAYVNMASHIFNLTVNADEPMKPLDATTIFNLNLSQKLTNYLMTPHEVNKHFQEVFGNVIHLNVVDEHERLVICKKFQDFILQILKEFKYYLPFDDKVLSKISCLDPDNFSNQDWLDLAHLFPNIIKPEEFHLFFDEVSSWALDIEKLKLQKNNFLDESRFDVVSFFSNLQIIRTFPLMSKLAKAILSLPLSSASVERVFSQFKLIKNERRNCLNNDTAQSLLIAKVNNIEMSDKKVLSEIYAQFEKRNPPIKRKISLISQLSIVSDKSLTPNIDKNEVLMGDETDSQLLQDKKKMLKLNSLEDLSFKVDNPVNISFLDCSDSKLKSNLLFSLNH